MTLEMGLSKSEANQFGEGAEVDETEYYMLSEVDQYPLIGFRASVYRRSKLLTKLTSICTLKFNIYQKILVSDLYPEQRN